MKKLLPLLILTMCLALQACAKEDIYVQWNGNNVKVDGVSRHLYICETDNGTLEMTATDADKNQTIHLSGKGTGRFILNSNHSTNIILDGLELQCDTSYAIVFKGKKSIKMTLTDGTVNILGDEGINAKGNLRINGNGSLTINATQDGHKGMRVHGDMSVTDNPTINITTSGQPLKSEKMTPPVMPQKNDGATRKDTPPMPEHPGNEAFVRYTYEGTSKGLKVSGSIAIKGGDINIKTSTPGAEGIETKDSLLMSGGSLHVEAHNDAISVGRKMVVTGGTIYAISQTNDGIDINGGMKPMGGAPTMDLMRGMQKEGIDPMQAMREMMKNRKPTYIQTGGSVTCKTLAPPPEEGLDTDEIPILHTGGTLNK